MFSIEAVEADLPEGYELAEVYYSTQRNGDERTVVLARRDMPTFPSLKYTTWEWGHRGLFWGHYDLNYTEGHSDFLRRCE